MGHLDVFLIIILIIAIAFLGWMMIDAMCKYIKSDTDFERIGQAIVVISSLLVIFYNILSIAKLLSPLTSMAT